ncbi:4-alpha-glucanotransferase [Phyllobacterium endophyticum]|uniref:4-alpha-glucanotransferase n=1 Tax=Phyllobacterium endophyticum TaxID=1149773 RepID=A0A2P7ANV1_9HYPH|nr:4-alpha-glucanotransferase [Phyllobacterium endophyticum]MBB3233775.1 4-alpha-glucanotransferase [Phyllobacterium endophyticum]PSH55886.1 4-alpha-glucanotransferase [Phyllobacterium endophyticum]TYR41026.1 4-alpha-glucanotransferase [Phyllobacterium endophyticum]
MTSRIDLLAAQHGISREYEGADGVRRLAPHDTKLKLLKALGVDPETPGGEAHLGSTDCPHQESLRCFLPDWLESARCWGISLQLYELRSARNWGIGDFADLLKAIQLFANAGADFIGLNPLHALFLAEPERNSPFSPSNRRFLNPLYISVPNVPGYQPVADELEECERIREGDLVDYGGVAALKVRALRRLWARWRDEIGARELAKDFERFQDDNGPELRAHALFESLSSEMTRRGHGAGWKSWPKQFQNRETPAVRSYASTHAGDVNFHMWLQWLAKQQLDVAQKEARRLGMRVGLYLDFAVGEAPDGSATWINRDAYIEGFNIGAPPDFFSAIGQDWGLVPPSPAALLNPHGTWANLLGRTMSNGGALRLDHAMSLRQLFLVPNGEPASSGTYLRYPFRILLEHLAKASLDQSCMVIGEDLGNVPGGFREEMERAAVLSYRVFCFEKEGTSFVPPERYPRLALACLSTHDLPTLRAWWGCDDIALRQEHNLIDQKQAAAQTEQRLSERESLLEIMARYHLIDPLSAAEVTGRIRDVAFPLPDTVMIAAHCLIARTPSLLVSIRLADLTGEEHPTNLPGTDPSIYPNWRRKNSIDLDELAGGERFRSLVAAVNQERPR